MSMPLFLRSIFASFGRALRLRQDIQLVGRGQIALSLPRGNWKAQETTLIWGDESKCLSSAHFTALQLGRPTLADHLFQIPCTANSAPNMSSRPTRHASEDDRPRYAVRTGRRGTVPCRTWLIGHEAHGIRVRHSELGRRSSLAMR
jgi:hypothetical protein